VIDADQIVVVEQGRIVEAGTNAELLFRRGVYSRLYQQFLAAAG
jgi:ABC-type multidrug transport system fused ATPase/permease subunit